MIEQFYFPDTQSGHLSLLYSPWGHCFQLNQKLWVRMWQNYCMTSPNRDRGTSLTYNGGLMGFHQISVILTRIAMQRQCKWSLNILKSIALRHFLSVNHKDHVINGKNWGYYFYTPFQQRIMLHIDICGDRWNVSLLPFWLLNLWHCLFRWLSWCLWQPCLSTRWKAGK